MTPAGHDVFDRWRAQARLALPHADADLVDEVAEHVAQRWMDARSAGLSASQADAVARADLAAWHSRALEAPPTRRSRWKSVLTGLPLDLSAAWRALGSRAASSAGAAILTVIGAAANVAVFAVVYGALWRPLPFPNEDRLAVAWQSVKGETGQISYPDYVNLRDAGVFEMSGALLGGVGTFVRDGAADRVQVVEAEPAVLALLGARPIVGRLLAPDDEGKPLAVISHRIWTSWFGADPAVSGRAFVLSGRPLTVVGVLPPRFDLELPVSPGFIIQHNDVWLSFDRSSDFLTRRDVSTYEVLGRLAPGTALAGAQLVAAATAGTLQGTEPETNRDRRFEIVPLRAQVAQRAARPLAFAFLGAVMILAITLANLTTLWLSRLSARHTELAVRESLGASRGRIARLLLLESVLTTIPSGAMGVGLGAWIATALASAPTAHLPRPDAIVFDAPVVLYAVLLLLVISAVPPLASMSLSARSAAVSSADSRIVGRSIRWSRRLLVAFEVALALVLTTSAGLLSLTVARLFAVDPGFATGGALTLRASAYSARYPTKAATAAFFNALNERLQALPGVARVAASSNLPLSGQMNSTSVMAAERPLPPADRLEAGWQFVTPGFFAAAGIPLLRGRDFTIEDAARTAHQTILNQAAARALFGDDNPIGRRVSVGGGEASSDWHDVIGVVGDVRHSTLADAPAPRVYDALGQHSGRTMFVVVRASAGLDAAALVTPVRKAIAAADPDVPVFEVATMESLVARSVGTRRLAAELALGLAAVSVILALVGTFAVIACAASERVREMGVRVALGASVRHIIRLMVGEALVTAAAGCAIGAGGGLLAIRLLREQLFGVRTSDGVMLVLLLAAGLALASVAAAWWPARRAARADPLSVIRSS